MEMHMRFRRWKKESEFVVLSENKMDMDGMIYEVNEDFMDMAKKVLEEE